MSPLSYLSPLFYFSLLHLSSFLPLFDASPLLIRSNPFLSPLLRWDAFHFLHITNSSYLYEHEWAFFPGLPFSIRSLSRLLRLFLPLEITDAFLFSGLLAACACHSTHILYRLSLHHLRSPELARIATLLSLVPTSPVTLFFAPYNEPFFTFFSYRGMLYCAQEKWFFAAISFSLAGTFRSNGMFLAGFILWGLLIRPFFRRRKMPKLGTLLKSVVLTAIVIAPFVAHHILAYSIFCTNPSSNPAPSWCSRTPPSLYTYVQSKYWGSGFMQYWTPSQIPNFLIAAPTVLLISAFSLHHLRKSVLLLGLASPRSETERKTTAAADGFFFQDPAITPHALHALFFMFVLVFASHTQIVLRLAASMPIVYWAAAWLIVERPLLGRLWVTWSVLWSLISTILWATFLPPA